MNYSTQEPGSNKVAAPAVTALLAIFSGGFRIMS